jgi:multicomponent Na+:H+ antiporter subunit G
MALQLLGLVILWAGVIFCALGVVGLLRLPDVYCRLHASGKISTVGLCGLLIGAALLMPSVALKVMGLGVFLIISSPVSSHAIALAAYRLGVPMQRSVRDDLGGHFRAPNVAD